MFVLVCVSQRVLCVCSCVRVCTSVGRMKISSTPSFLRICHTQAGEEEEEEEEQRGVTKNGRRDGGRWRERGWAGVRDGKRDRQRQRGRDRQGEIKKWGDKKMGRAVSVESSAIAPAANTRLV